MLKLVVILIFLCGQSNCFDKGICYNTYKNCKREVIVAEDRTDTVYRTFQDFLPIHNLTFNKANEGEILDMRFYFQGRADFSVVFSSKNEQPAADEKVFQTIIAYDCGLHRSAVFLNKVYDVYNATMCDCMENIPNPMNQFYLQQVDVIVNKKYGLIMWFIPELGAKPLLSCFDPDIANIKYISFSGYRENTVRYIFDCPANSEDLAEEIANEEDYWSDIFSGRV